MFGTPSVGDHVRLRETHRRWFGSDVKRGRLGVVRATHFGLMSSDVTVEMADGSGTVRLPASNVRRTGGSGDGGAYRLAQDWHRAKLVAGVILFIPVAIGLARFFVAGGKPSELILPLAEGALDTIFALLNGPFGGAVALGILAMLVRNRISRR